MWGYLRFRWYLTTAARFAKVPLLFFALFGEGFGKAEDFYIQEGTDPSFEEVMDSGDLPRGNNSGNGFEGTRVKINHEMLDDGPNAKRPLIKEILIHTLGHSAIRRSDFSKWSRWYQEDGNTQIFRLFKDEENVRNSRKLAARIEAFSDFSWEEGDGWQEWVGTYTIIKPHRCAILQVKNPINDWAVMLNMNDDGDITLNHRRGEDKVIARNMTGKPFHIRVRDNGLDYEVYLNGKKEGEGSYARPKAETSFRWGMYLGAKEVKHDAMILVTGAEVNPRDSGDEYVHEEETKEEEPKLQPEPGIPIPSRAWKNKQGGTVTAAARYVLGSDVIKLDVDGKWIAYSLSDLSESDRYELAKALESLDE